MLICSDSCYDSGMGNRPRKLDKRLVLVDMAALLVSFFVGLWFRFGLFVQPWQTQLYSAVFVGELVSLLLIHLWRVPRQKNPSFYLLDPVDIFVEHFHNVIILLAILVVFLVGTQTAERISRLFLAYSFICDLILGYAFRLLYWKWTKQHHRQNESGRRYVVVTRRPFLDRVLATLKAQLPKEDQVVGYVLLDEPWGDSWKDRLAGVSGQPAEVFVYLPQDSDENIRRVLSALTDAGWNGTAALSLEGEDVLDGQVGVVGGFASFRFDALQNRVSVLGTSYTATTIGAAVSYIKWRILQDRKQDRGTVLLSQNGTSHNQANETVFLSGKGNLAREEGDKRTVPLSWESQDDKNATKEPSPCLSGQYLCFSNVHTTVMGYEDPAYRRVLNGAAYVFPDGSPIASKMRRVNTLAQRVPGPDFMGRMFRATMDGSVRHFFYGSTQETLDLLRENLERNYPGLVIAGMYSPPFRALTPEEDAAVVRMINESGADIVWVGLGAPKQEQWMAAHRGQIHGVMAGVGAGFNFHAGNIRRAPYWVQKIGMEWLYRLFQDPKRLWSRYLVTNTKFVWYSLTDRAKDSNV